jgi:molybdopterin-guanine dinucleotide biosynthesis protein A
MVTVEALWWLARHPSQGSIVPNIGGRAQPLCARYQAKDLRVAAQLVAAGRRSLRDLLDAIRPELGAPPHPAALKDVDTPQEWSELLVALPGFRSGG